LSIKKWSFDSDVGLVLILATVSRTRNFDAIVDISTLMETLV